MSSVGRTLHLPFRVANTGYEFLYGLSRRTADGPDVVIRPVLQRVEHILQLLAKLVDTVTGVGKVYADMSGVERLVLEVCGLQVALPNGQGVYHVAHLK